MGFFGVVLEPGEKEPVEVPGGWRLQLCSAVLEPNKSEKGKEPKGTLWVEVEEEDEPEELKMGSYMLAKLQGTGSLSQMALTHSFNSMDDTIYFEARGSSAIHLTGFFTKESLEDANFGFDDEDEEDEEDEDEDEEDEEMEAAKAGLNLPTGKPRKAAGGEAGLNGRAPRAAATAAARSWSKGEAKGGNAEEDEDDEDDDEYVAEEGEDEDDEDDDEEEEEGEEAGQEQDMDVGEDEEDEQEGKKGAEQGGKRGASEAADGSASARPPIKKSRKGEKRDAPVSKGGDDEESSTEGDPEAEKKAQKLARQKEKKKKAAEAKRAMNEAFTEGAKEKEQAGDVQLKNPMTKKRKGGLKVTDIVVGSGAEAQQGKNVRILYTGSFPNGKVFDKSKSRKKPLEFRVGMQSVIAGMDRGLLGMQVGGLRKLEIPSALGYGKEGTGPVPPNQDLVFEVELLGVSGKK